MNILLDTCTFLWMLDDDSMLGSRIRPAIEDGSNRVFLHQASAWEIQIKYDLGKLPLLRLPQELIREGALSCGIEYLPLKDEEIWHLAKLPRIHRDPFDRILISCAACSDFKLATPDPRIAQYAIPVLW